MKHCEILQLNQVLYLAISAISDVFNLRKHLLCKKFCNLKVYTILLCTNWENVFLS